MTLIDGALAIVGVVAIVGLAAWWRWGHRRTVVDARDHYDSAVVQFPGRCFRLRRDPATGLATPCDEPVVGSGAFTDHRGNVLEVEACDAHRTALTGWRGDPGAVAGGIPPGRGRSGGS
jgi:hypothetical protein